MEYEVYTNEEGKRRVRFIDCNNEDYCVEQDESGKEYFPIPNILHPEYQESVLARLFTGRVRDAVESIKLGHADALCKSGLFGSNSVKPIRFVDREYGEELRAKSLSGWKDTEFAHVIRINPMGFGSSVTVLADGKLGDVADKNIMWFQSEEAARIWLDDYSAEMDKIVESYLESEEANRPQMLDDIFKDGISLRSEMFESRLAHKEGNDKKVEIRVEQEVKQN